MRRDSFLSHPSLLLHFGLFFLTNSPSVIGEFSYNQCNHSTTYAHDSNYSHNLNTLIDELTYNVGETGYTNSSFGGNPDKVYGLLFCVGSVSSQECIDCIKDAQISYSRYCWNATGARIWIRNCFLRYDNYNFISQLDTDGFLVFNSRAITSNLRDFQSTKNSLISNLSVKVYDPAKMRYAVGSDNFSTSGRVYGLVQCWGDISNHDCRTCLSTAMQSLEDTAPTSEGAQAMLATCLLRYEIYSFFNSAAESPAEIHQPISKKKSSRKFPIILGITGGVPFGIVVYLFTTRSSIKSVISRRATTLMTQSEDEETGLFKKEQIVFTLETLAEATGDFHDNNKLGEGGFGPVYKAWRLHKRGDVLSMVDYTLVDDCPAEQVLRCIHIALLCTQADAETRPLISNVITMISTASLFLPTPSRPAFVSMTSESPNISRAPVIPSTNECSISTLEPRNITGDFYVSFHPITGDYQEANYRVGLSSIYCNIGAYIFV